MTVTATLPPTPIFVSGPQPCGYFDHRTASYLFLDPGREFEAPVYAALLAAGFRRSGGFVYRPRCPGCTACVPLRVDAAAFRPRRWARRILKANADLDVAVVAMRAQPEHLALYRRYQAGRHPGSGMQCRTLAEYAELLFAPWADTVQIEMRLAGRLVAVAVTDRTPDALSAVYTYYEPRLARRGLGTCAILHQIRLAAAAGRRWLYLGYWIAGHPKMGYKARFRPCEILVDGSWRILGAGMPPPPLSMPPADR